MRLLALTCLLAAALSGCDFISAGSDGPSANVTGITLDQLPLVRSNGTAWDADGAPDVFLEVQDALGRVYVDSRETTEVTEAGTRLSAHGAIRNFDRDYFLYVVDMDEDGAKQDMGAISRLSFEQAALDRAPRVTFHNGTDTREATLRVTLDLEWSDAEALAD